MSEIEIIRAKLWARVYADALQRGEIWYRAAEVADTALSSFDRRKNPEQEPTHAR